MESKAAVTLHFEDLAVNNNLFYKIVYMRLWKSQIVLLSTFDQCKLYTYFFLYIWKTKCNSVRKGLKKCPFLHTVKLSLQNI